MSGDGEVHLGEVEHPVASHHSGIPTVYLLFLSWVIALLVTRLLSALMLGWLAALDPSLYLEEKFTLVEVSTLVFLS